MASPDTASLLVGLLLLFHTWGAWANVEVNMEGKVEVYLGQTAQITCMFTSTEGVGGRVLQWFYVTDSGERQRIYHQDSMDNSADQNTRFTSRISVNSTGDTNVVLTISDVALKDEVEFICLIKTFTGESGEGRTKLRVFEPPKVENLEGSPLSGISVSEEEPSMIGTCVVRNGYPKPTVTWYRDNTPLHNTPGEVKVESATTTESTGLFSVESKLYMKVVKEDKDSEFYCEVVYFVPGATKMIETNRIKVNVFYPHAEVNIWVKSPKDKIKEGDTVELQCDGNGNSPSAIFSIKMRNGEDSPEGSMLVLNNVTRLNSGEYVCTITDWDEGAEITNSTEVFVNYLDPAVVSPKGSTVVAQRGELEATCNALSSLSADKAWFKNGVKVSEGNTLTLKDATFDTAGTYVCVVTVPEIEGMETTGTLDVYVQGPPQIMEQDFTEIEGFRTVDLTCHVRGYPVPKVTWTPTEQVTVLSEEDTKEGFRSVRAQVNFNSDITVFCNAINEYGNHSVAFDIKAIPSTAHNTTTTAATTTTSSTTTTTTISNSNNTATTKSPQKIKKEGNGVVIVVIIICLLLLAILGSVLFFLYKKGKICGRSGKKDLSKVKSNKDNIVVEMKSDNTEEAILLGVNGEKQLPSDQ